MALIRFTLQAVLAAWPTVALRGQRTIRRRIPAWA
jgi:hypothetical protein